MRGASVRIIARDLPMTQSAVERHAEAIMEAMGPIVGSIIDPSRRQAILTAVEAAMAEGAAMERAKIVAWLANGSSFIEEFNYAAECITLGEQD